LQVWVDRDTRERDAEARADKLLQAMREEAEGRPFFSTPPLGNDYDALSQLNSGSDLIRTCIVALGDLLTSD
jgi:hypothetical protein